MIEQSIFKAYDIRGVVDKTLTEEAVRRIGRAYGIAALAKSISTVVIGRDGRLSGPTFAKALSEGLRDQGINVIDIGMVATPFVYYATYQLKTAAGIMITGSHNPPDYNGLKMVLAGAALYGDDIQNLYQLIAEGKTQLPVASVAGTEQAVSIFPDYLARVLGDVKLARRMKIAIDCGNGSPGAYAAEVFRHLGCEVTELFCDVDGHFPNHHPDPAHAENLQDLIACLRNTDCEIGLAFDGDGDRLGVVTKDGQIIWPDRQLMLFARDVLAQRPGSQIIYDVKCSRLVASVVREAGGQPLMWRTGHSLIKAKLRETGAALAGEMSGHVFFNDRWYGFDDALYVGARLLEILSRSNDPSSVLNALPNAPTTPEIQIKVAEGENKLIIDQLIRTGQFDGHTEIITIDGVRAEYADGFGLARSSNTTPLLVLRFEADTAEALARIQAQFKAALLAINSNLPIPF
jgi:phosphomannomutase / phosphoglucomutase